tara:strand:- start:309 stop:1226 length:918 start_codon:yes stop_codon:yes gene_type:complete
MNFMGSKMPPPLESFGYVMHPADAEEPILSPVMRRVLLEWLEEYWARDALAEVGLQARRRALLNGLPGTGKTTLAHHLAARIGLPLLVVQSEKVISKYVGESAQHVGGLFEALTASAQAGDPHFLFLDEFDSLAARRRDGESSADQSYNHMVNTLLAHLERHDGFVIAATNFGDRIDEAVWRRFEINITLELPGLNERKRILARYLAPFVLPPAALQALAGAMDSATPALMRQFAESIKRQIVVGEAAGWVMNRQTVIERVLATVRPHPDAQQPRLWTEGVNDASVAHFPWPLHRALDDYQQEEN